MLRSMLLGLAMASLAACEAQETNAATALAGSDEADVTREDIVAGLCEIIRGEHVAAPAGGNRSVVSSNGVTIGVFGSRSTSTATRNGVGTVTVSAPATLHLTFADGTIATVSVAGEGSRVEVAIGGPDDITCRADI